MSTAEVKAAMLDAVNHGNETVQGTQGLHGTLDQALARVQQATQQTSHDKPGEAMTLYQQAKNKADELVLLVQRANTACEEYAQSI